MRRRHQRQLVDRQRPADAVRDREGRAGRRRRSSSSSSVVECLDVRRPAECERAGQRHARARADRQHEEVVRRAPRPRPCAPPACPGRPRRGRRAGSAPRARRPARPAAPACVVARPNGSRNRQRPVCEVGVGGDQLHRHPGRRELAEGEQRLRARDAAAGDQHCAAARRRGPL